MEIEILKLIRTYIAEHREPDEEYIRTLFEIIVSQRKLEDYIDCNRIKMTRTANDENVASYLKGEGKVGIQISWPLIKHLIHTLKGDLGCEFKDIERRYLILLAVAEIVYEETEFAAQEKALDSKDDSIKTRIIASSIDALSLKIRRPENMNILEKIAHSIHVTAQKRKIENKYTSLLDFAPGQRMADIETINSSLVLLRSMYAHEDSDFKLLYAYEEGRKMNMTLHAYHTTLSPTMHYFANMGYSFERSNPFDGETITLDERMFLGLDINSVQYNQKCKEFQNHKRLLMNPKELR